jgi:hypothetical protein
LDDLGVATLLVIVMGTPLQFGATLLAEGFRRWLLAFGIQKKKN